MTKLRKEYTIKINGIEQSIKDVTSLEDAIKSLDKTVTASDRTVSVSAKSIRAKTQALTEEEKAQKKLTETIGKAVHARTDENRAQIDAANAAREVQRHVVLQQKANAANTETIKGMRAEINLLNHEWAGLEVGTEEFDRMTEKIRVLTERVKEAEAAKGDFRRNVGNYPDAMRGIEELSAGFEGLTRGSKGLALSMMGTNQLMGLFGHESDESAQRARQLQRIIGLLNIAHQVNNNIVRHGIMQGKIAIVTDKVRTMQLKAKTKAEIASTKSTIGATIAQKAFNIVASANPFVLLALAIVAVGAALFMFMRNTRGAADEQRNLNELQALHIEAMQREATLIRESSKARINALEHQLRRQRAVGASLEEIQDIENRMLAERQEANKKLQGFHANELRDLEKNKELLQEMQQEMLRLQEYQRRGYNRVPLRTDGTSTPRQRLSQAVEDLQKRMDNYGELITIGVELKADTKEIETFAIEQRERQRREQERIAQDAADAARRRARNELSIQRAAEDARLRLIQDSDEQARQALTLSHNRQIEDLRKRLATEKDLTANARKAINDLILSLEQQHARDLDNLARQQADRTAALQREVEDSRLSLMLGAHDRQMAEINVQHNRQIEALQRRLETETHLTEREQAKITEMILNAQKSRGIALSRLIAEQVSLEADLQLGAVEDTLRRTQRLIGEVDVFSNGGLIDVEATRRNLDGTNAALDEYIDGLTRYLDTLRTAHIATLDTLQAGSLEYEAELQRYARTVEDIMQRISDAQLEQARNAKRAANLNVEALQVLFDQITYFANATVKAVNAVLDTWNMGLRAQLDDLFEQMDAVNERFREAQQERENAAANVEYIEQRLRNATGGTAVALQEQLKDTMRVRAEAEREEARLAAEKEKREAEIAKRERQMRRNDLMAGIAQAIANTAQGVTRALGLMFPLNMVVAGIVGATGAAQVGIMTRQITKLEKGGLIKGASHANGGVPILGTNIEVEGGEFVVNKKSYGANANLVKFINETPRTVTVADLAGVLPNNTVPITSAAKFDSDRIVEAIEGIEIKPVVSVADINDVAETMTDVEDLSNFN